MNPTSPVQNALDLFRDHNGQLRTSQALRLGISPRTLYTLRDQGWVTQLSRGLFRLTDTLPLTQPDLVTIAMKIPSGVVCLISALAFHDLTTQVPHAVHLALPSQSEKPRLSYPPLRLFWLTERAYRAGIETHTVDGVTVKVYDLEKTLADCFKFRRKIGVDIALEALKQGVEQKRVRADKFLEYAEIDRVRRVVQPYLEVLF